MTKKNRLLHAVPSLSVRSGGPARSVTQLCSHLCNNDLVVDIITAIDRDEQLVSYDSRLEIIPVLGQNMTMMGRLFASDFRTPLEAARKDYQIIHQSGMWLKCSHQITDYANRHNIPLLLSPRGMVEIWAMNYRRTFKLLAWKLFQKRDLHRVSVFHATSVLEADNLRSLGLSQPICIIPNGVELSSPIRRQVRKTGELKTALFLSRINPKKGILMLLDAWRNFLPTDWRLIIAGNDDSNHLPEVKARLVSLGLQDCVEIFGPAYGNEKDRLLKQADAFILPSYSENFGIVVAEALGYSLPVFTTTGCPWNELTEYDCGWWVDPDPLNIEQALKEMLTTPSIKLIEMGVRGRQLVEQNYQWHNIAQQMSSVYDWILKRGDRPECMYD